MLKQIPKSDIVVRPVKFHKEWTLDQNDIYPLFGLKVENTTLNVDTDEKTYGIYRKILYNSIKHQFYTNSDTASILTEVGLRKSYASTDERVLENEFALFSIPQIKYGEGIQIGSVTLEDKDTNKLYIDDGYSNLVSGSVICGNVLYDRGYVILTKGVVSGSVLNQFVLNYNSTVTVYENEIFLTILEGEFNVSTNPSSFSEFEVTNVGVIVDDPKTDQQVTKSFANLNYATVNPLFLEYDYSSSVDRTGSYLAPFITTIGLYDDENQMVAVAKLPQPIKSLPDYPVNFLIRFDT